MRYINRRRLLLLLLLLIVDYHATIGVNSPWPPGIRSLGSIPRGPLAYAPAVHICTSDTVLHNSDLVRTNTPKNHHPLEFLKIVVPRRWQFGVLRSFVVVVRAPQCQLISETFPAQRVNNECHERG